MTTLVLRRLAGRFVPAACLVLALGTAPCLAQPAEDPVRRPRMDTSAPAAAPAANAGGVMQQQTGPFFLQAAVVVLLSGGAVWAVCRSSRRG